MSLSALPHEAGTLLKLGVPDLAKKNIARDTLMLKTICCLFEIQT